MLASSLESKLMDRQAKTIKDTGRNFSFSACVNEVIKEGLK